MIQMYSLTIEMTRIQKLEGAAWPVSSGGTEGESVPWVLVVAGSLG